MVVKVSKWRRTGSRGGTKYSDVELQVYAYGSSLHTGSANIHNNVNGDAVEIVLRAFPTADRPEQLRIHMTPGQAETVAEWLSKWATWCRTNGISSRKE